jgi:hypothetical protein
LGVGQYHFDEHKPIRAAAETDFHYYRIANCLRQSRRAMTSAGMQLISVTPHSRLNGWFAYQPASDVIREIRSTIGDQQREVTTGLYTNPPDRMPPGLESPRDFRPPGWPAQSVDQPTMDGELLVEAEGPACLMSATPQCESA